jgi:hypothetical protein
MFKKPGTVKNLSVLRSTDRKKVVQSIVEFYGWSDEIKAALLPEGAQVDRTPPSPAIVLC